nr:hypothetical protein [Tanacetum cinerariifolium]
MIIPFLSCLNDYYCDEKKGSYGLQCLDSYSYGATRVDNSLPRKEKDPGSFTLPSYINNVCSKNAFADLGASVSVMPLLTYLNLGLGKLAHTKLTVELADKTVKHPKGIAENVLVGIGKFVVPVDFIILDILEDVKVPLILGRPFLYTAHAKIDVFKRKITLRVGDVKNIFKREIKVDDLMPTIEEVVENMDGYRDQDMEDAFLENCDDESSHEEVIHKMSFKTYSNPLFDLDEEIISSKFNPIHNEDLDSTPKNDRFDTKYYLLESLLNHDTLMASSPNFDYLLEEFSGELVHTDLIPSGINEANCDPEEDIHLVERLLYDNSSPRPLEEFNSENSDVIIESFSPSPILVEDSDSLMEEIDLFLTSDNSMPPSIENDDHDSEGDILFLEELLSNDSPSLPENDSFHFDVPSSPRPPAKPPDDDEIKPNTRVLIVKVVGDISKH